MASRPFAQAASGASQHTPGPRRAPLESSQARARGLCRIIRGTGKEQDTKDSDMNKEDENYGVKRADDDGMVE